jgi:hypothetical protein
VKTVYLFHLSAFYEAFKRYSLDIIQDWQLYFIHLIYFFFLQLGRIYLDMLNVYKVMSENISSAIASNGESVTKQPLIRSMRTVKKEALKLISGWVTRSNDPQMVKKIMIILLSVEDTIMSLTYVGNIIVSSCGILSSLCICSLSQSAFCIICEYLLLNFFFLTFF